jgi:hypothetical protein
MGSSLTQQKNIFACVLRIAQSIFSFSASGIDPVVLEIQRIFEFFLEFGFLPRRNGHPFGAKTEQQAIVVVGR